MADLSKVQTRVTQENRRTRNRDSLIPSRRDTDAPQRRVFADVRNASRGDGGAEALMKALGMVNKAAGDFQQYANDRYEKREEELGSQGLYDEAMGEADPELIRKSRAYRNSVFTQRAQSAYYENAEKLDDEIKGIVNSADPELADPLKRATAIEAAIDANFREFAVDPETGKLRDWGAPGAAKWLGQQLASARAEVRAKALQLVEEKANEDSIANVADAFGASIDAGVPLSFEEAMSTLLPTADRRKAKEAILVVLQDRASSLRERALQLDETDPIEAERLRVRALEIVDRVRGSRRAPAQADPRVIAETPAGEPVVTAEAPAEVSVDVQLAAIEHIESRGRQPAVSPKGAVGVMQVMPRTGPEAARLAGLEWDPKRFRRDEAYNRALGQAYYRKQLEDFGDPIKAAAAYNAGPGRVRELIRVHGDNWQSKLPKETKDYIAKFTERTGAQPAAKPWQEGPALPGEVLDPTLPSEIAAADPTGAGSPLYSLNATERAQLGQFRRQLASEIDRDAEAALTKRQGTTALDFMGRLHGMGAYPTPGEVQQAARRGDISVSHAVSILSTIEQDQNEARSEERAVRAEARAQRAEESEARYKQVDRNSDMILAPFYGGKIKTEEAQRRLVQLLPTIEDREVRQSVYREVTQGIAAQVDLRNASPEYRGALSRFDEWSTTYKSLLTRGRQIAREDRGRAEAIVDEWLNRYRVRLTQYANLPPERVDTFMQRAEKDLDAAFERRFPPRVVGTQVRGAGR